MRQLYSVSVAFVCVVAVGPASAQIVQPPSRSSNGLFGGSRATVDPNRTGQEISATVNLLGSYEDNLTPPDQNVVTDPFIERQSGTTGSVSGEMRYRYGRASRLLESTGRAYVHGFRDLGVSPMYGGSADLFGSTRLGQRTRLGAGAYASYQPTFMLTSGAPLSDVEVAPINPTSGVVDIRTRNAYGTSTFTVDWTRRQHTRFTYDYSRVRVTGGALTNSSTHNAGAAHTWDVSRPFGLLTSYGLSEMNANTSGFQARPTRTQTALLGVELRKRVSRTRSMLFNAGGGAMHVRATSEFDNRLFNYVVPSYFAGSRLDVGRTWSVAFDAHRDVTMLDAVSPQSFVNDTVNLRLGGQLSTSWQLAFYGSWSQGKPHQGEIGSFDAGNGSAQVQYNLMRCCSLIGSYEFYYHLLHQIEAVPAGFPRRFERNAIAVGISMFLPLYGQFRGTGRN